jgi:hypothetical protein
MGIFGIHILDLPTWFCCWGGHVISTLGAGDKPAHPFHLDRIYTHFFTMSTRCVPCLSDAVQQVYMVV